MTRRSLVVAGPCSCAWLCLAPRVASAAVERRPRSGWVCPNGNSFETCTHQCKWIEYVDGRLDTAREASCGPEILAHSGMVAGIYNRLFQTFNTCSQTNEVLKATSPCNYFLGAVATDVFHVKDFNTGPNSYMSANAIYDWLYASSITNGLWKPLDPIGAQAMANSGEFVVATTREHVAIVSPGTASVSASWKVPTPVVFSMSHYDAQRGKSPLRCMPCYTNQIFGTAPLFYMRQK